MSKLSSSLPTVGSFADAERTRIRQMAKLTPKQRVKIVCSMNSIARRVARMRANAAKVSGR